MRDTAPDPQADIESVARTIALDRLSTQARSRGELAQTLAAKHVPDDVAADLLDRFEQVGLIDDEAYARAWVESRQRSKGLASSVLSMELRRKGIADDLIREVLADVDPQSERDAAHRLVQRKLRSVRGLDPSVQVRRLTSMLARKGYAPQVAFDVVRAELEVDAEPIEST